MDARADRWLRLVHAPGIGHGRRRRLLAELGDIDRITGTSSRDLRKLGVSAQAAAVLHGDEHPAGLEADLQWATTPGCHLVTPDHRDWPSRLAALDDPPALLYVRGDPEVLRQPALAIVGSRNPTPAGAETASQLAHHLAAAGLVIVSGMAYGIDAAAHEGALAAGGLTVAVAGTGIDRVYPARHAELARRIAREGALVSELPVGTPPARAAFPQRNRIVTGLCLGTLVVEAAVQSGSLVSARHAMEQGSEVFAIPGSIHSPLARGCHRLIRQGAKLVETADDILEELGPQIALPARAAADQDQPRRAGDDDQADDDADYATVLNALDWEPRGVDDIASRSGQPAGEVASMLLRLELDGRIRIVPGGLYQRR